LTWKLGGLDRAEVIYKSVGRLGRQHGEPELETRAANGFCSLAQVRGDSTAAKRWAEKGTRLARRHGFPELALVAHHGLMVIAAKAQDFDAALVHGWAAYELSVGNAASMDELLSNLGQLLLDVGYADAARAAFAAVLSRPQPARVGLPALGGLAGAAARMGDHDLLNWTASEILRQSEEGNQPYQTADALCDCASALGEVGDVARAERCAAAAAALADRFGYRDVASRASALLIPSTTSPHQMLQLAPRARRVAREILALDPARLPDRVVFAAVA
jgi:hypothetical protein